MMYEYANILFFDEFLREKDRFVHFSVDLFAYALIIT